VKNAATTLDKFSKSQTSIQILIKWRKKTPGQATDTNVTHDAPKTVE